MTGERIGVTKVKRPGGLRRFDLEFVQEDEHGTWLFGEVGSHWTSPKGVGVFPNPYVMLLAPGRPWGGWFIDFPHGPVLSIDVCLPAERTLHGWTYVDLELDPVRHERSGLVEVEDWDEYEEALVKGWMSGADGELAQATSEELAEELRQDTAGWIGQGWKLLANRLRG